MGAMEDITPTVEDPATTTTVAATFEVVMGVLCTAHQPLMSALAKAVAPVVPWGIEAALLGQTRLES